MRNMALANGPNDGTRGLDRSVLYPEVLKALRAWIHACPEGTMIGGVALSHYVKPRTTQDVDFLFIGHIPELVAGFRRTRPGAFQHNGTHVEIEVITPASVGMSIALARWIDDGSLVDRSLGTGVRIASPSGIAASKLGRIVKRTRGWQQDVADIASLIHHCGVDLTGAPLTDEERLALQHVIENP